mmetsp:Transcript_45109/g.74202  ORF Transcript_45109/g.74202 Transcript_45109/m.74202 type:complete len:110 (-) Transcript_45109:901-1230(-)
MATQMSSLVLATRPSCRLPLMWDKMSCATFRKRSKALGFSFFRVGVAEAEDSKTTELALRGGASEAAEVAETAETTETPIISFFMLTVSFFFEAGFTEISRVTVEYPMT